MDHLQLELDQQRVDLRRALAETESVARQSREKLENQVCSHMYVQLDFVCVQMVSEYTLCIKLITYFKSL